MILTPDRRNNVNLDNIIHNLNKYNTRENFNGITVHVDAFKSIRFFESSKSYAQKMVDIFYFIQSIDLDGQIVRPSPLAEGRDSMKRCFDKLLSSNNADELVKESMNRCTNEMIEQYNDVKFRLSLETTSEEDKVNLLKRKELLENGIENFFKMDRISRIHFHQSSLNDNTMERCILVLRPNRIGCLGEAEEKRIIELGRARRQREGAIIKKTNFANLVNRRLAIPGIIKRPVVRPTFATKQIKASRNLF